MPTPNRIAIVGGGPGGLMLGRLLQLHGLNPTIFERDIHSEERPQGGSLDLHEQTGLHAIKLAGLEEAFLSKARPEDQGDRLYDADATLLFDDEGQDFGRPEIDRGELRRLLLHSLMPGTVRWGHKVERLTVDERGDVLISAGGTVESFDIVIGADGAWSRVRPLLSEITPVYEGVTFAELGFDSRHHPVVDGLVGKGKMFAVGNNRLLVAQRNGDGHIRVYAAQRMPETEGEELAKADPIEIRATMLKAFSGWAHQLKYLIEEGNLIGVRLLHALPIGHKWPSRQGVTLLGDAAHLMSPFAGEGVNLALADAADLAAALVSGEDWPAVASYEAYMVERATSAATEAADGLSVSISSAGASGLLEHYRQRSAA